MELMSVAGRDGCKRLRVSGLEAAEIFEEVVNGFRTGWGIGELLN